MTALTWRLAWADLRRSPTTSLILAALICLCTLLVATGAGLVARTMSATNVLWSQAQPPDLVQMHSGDIDPEAVATWASTHPQVTDHLVVTTLPVPGAQMWIDGASQAGSVLEPALVLPSERFDLLVDAQGRPADPDPGEIWLPVHYQAVGQAQVGSTVTLRAGGEDRLLRVAGFFRDSQMNPSLVTSKRIVVNQADFEWARPHLEAEYLVEMRTAPGSATSMVMDDYRSAGLPANGISVDASIFRLMNGLTTYLLAAAILLVALVLSVTMLLALRFALLTAFESELSQIATLKAIGAPAPAIKSMYSAKYALLAAAGVSLGLAGALPLTSALQRPVLLYLGQPQGVVATLLVPATGGALVLALVLASCRLVLARTSRAGAVQMLHAAATGDPAPHAPGRLRRVLRRPQPAKGSAGTAPPRRRPLLPGLLGSGLPVADYLGLRGVLRASSALLVAVVGLAVVSMSLPAAVLATMSSPSFSTYLGVGQADLRLDLPAGSAPAPQVEQVLASEPGVSRHVQLVSERYEIRAAQGQWGSVLVQSGDHDVFPLSYEQGRAPRESSEVALSHNQAKEMGAGLGQVVELERQGQVAALTVTGVYQDITFGGKTAKAQLPASASPLWRVVYIDLKEPEQAQAVAERLAGALPGAKATPVQAFTDQTLGATTSQLRTVVRVAAVAGCAVTLVITALATVLVLTRERGQIATLRAIGAGVAGLRRQYLWRLALPALVGAVAGVVASGLLGQPLLRATFGALGAPGVRLEPDPLISWLLLPAVVLAAVAGALVLGLRGLSRTHLTEQE